MYIYYVYPIYILGIVQNLIHCIFGAGIEISALFSIIINRVDCCKYVIAVGHTRVWRLTANMRKEAKND